MNSRSAFVFIVCVCIVCMLLSSCISPGVPEASESLRPSAAVPPETKQTETPLPTAEPTEQTPAAEPTDLSTAEPFVPVASCGPGYEGKYVIRSSYDWWLEETCRAILEGRLSDVKFPENVDKFVHFAGDSTHEFVNANSSSVTIYHGDDGTGEVETVNDCPVFKIPYDIAVKAQNSMFDHFEEVGPRLLQRSDELFFECGGFCGEDWFVLQSEQWLNLVSQRIHTIWRRDESGNWYEFGNNNTELVQIIGVRILSDTTGFMCCYSAEYDEGRGCRLFGTFDGGETWQDMELDLPDEFDGYETYWFYSPVFFGEYGVTIAHAYRNNNVRRGCFITSDGGHSWQFMPLDTRWTLPSADLAN